MHFAFVPVTEDKKRGGEKVSAKEVITKNDLKTFHTDLERYLDSFRDWHFEVVNEATKDGNKEIAELKKQTAHEEVLKAQQEALQARQRALQEQESIKPLVEQKNALRGEIEALQTEKEVLTAAEVEAIKGEKTLLGGLKGVTHKEFEAVKRTAVAVESMTAERDQALARAARADLQATAAEAKVKTAYKDANRQLQAKIREVEQDRPSMKAQMEIVQLRKENQTLKTENSSLCSKVADLEATVRRLVQIIREKLPEVYAAITQPKRDRQQPPAEAEAQIKGFGTLKAVLGYAGGDDGTGNASFLFRRRRRNSPKNPEVKGIRVEIFVRKYYPSLDFWIARTHSEGDAHLFQRSPSA